MTMLLGGLWHGAAWTFVFWGAYHGALLAADSGAGSEPRRTRWIEKTDGSTDRVDAP